MMISMLRLTPNEERFIHGAKPCGSNAVELSRVGADTLGSMCIVLSMCIVNEDWGWVKSRQGHPAGSSETAIRGVVSGARRVGAGGRGSLMVSCQHLGA